MKSKIIGKETKKKKITWKYTLIGLACGLFVMGAIFSELNWNWTMIIPVPLGLIIGNGLDNKINKIY